MKKLGVLLSLIFFVCLEIAAQESYTISEFPMVKQQRSLWCWAACAQMIDAKCGMDTVTTQCQFATYYLKSLYKKTTNLLCPNTTLGTCNENSSFLTGNTAFSFPALYFGIRFEQVLSHIGLYSSFERRPKYEEIKNELNYDRPLIAFVSTVGYDSTVANHIVVVKGYRETTTDTFLILNDPWFHSGESACTMTTTLEFNYTATTQTGSVKSITAFLMNIHPKNMVLSAPPSFRRTSLSKQNKHTGDSLYIENDTVRLKVKVLSVKKIKSLLPIRYEKKFLKNEVYELYSPSARRSYVYEKTSKGNKLTEIKQANYPIELKDTALIDDLKEVTLWQYPLPPFHYFYEFKYKNRTVVVPLSNVQQKNGIKLEDDMFYSPHRVMNNLRKHNRYFFGRKLFLFFFTKMIEKDLKVVKSTGTTKSTSKSKI